MALCKVRKYPVVLLCCLALGFAGCNPQKAQMEAFNRQFQAGRYDSAAKFAQQKARIDNPRPKREDLLWTLQLAGVERIRGDFSASTKYLDKSEEKLNYFDYESPAVRGLAATLATDNILPYVGTKYDRIMVNTYKALNFIFEDDPEHARIEFNRALDRQRRAKERFEAEISKLQDEISQQRSAAGIERTINNPQVMRRIYERYPSLRDFEVYPDFINPFTTYLAGIFFAMDDDLARAADMFRESYGMVSDNPYIEADLAGVEEALDYGYEVSDNVWVIFENGLGPVKREFRVDLPLYLVSDQVRYAGIALPMLEYRHSAYPHLLVRTADGEYRTELVASMDRVINTEFEKEFQATLIRSLASAAVKTVAQYSLSRDQGDPAALLMSIYSVLTTSADVRIWSTLPKNFQAARVEMPPDGRISVVPPGVPGSEIKINLPECKNALIYIIIPHRHAEPVHRVVAW